MRHDTLHEPIHRTADLVEFCDRLRQAPFLALDTEFIRERTYFPQLCLIQVAGNAGGHDLAGAIDPLAEGIDLAPFYELIAEKDRLLVLHAGKQDLEIFLHKTGALPPRVFDTQIAGQFLGYGEAVSYGELVRRTLKVTLDKGMRFTDWAKRPLNERQLTYALGDVTFLQTLYPRVLAALESKGRLGWAEAEMRVLADPSLYRTAPEDAWKRLKTGHITARQLSVLREIAAWRESEAMRRDIPRGRIVRDDSIVEIAALMPATRADLQSLRGNSLPGWAVEPLLEAVARGANAPQESWPVPASRRRDDAEDVEDAVQMLQMLLRIVSAQTGILPRLLATRDELEALARGARDIRPLQEWRREIFGLPAIEMLEGRLSLRYDPEKRAALLDAQAPLPALSAGTGASCPLFASPAPRPA